MPARFIFSKDMYVLITKLKQSKLGCRIGDVYLGSLWEYADDILLLAFSVTQLQKMLDICSNFADDMMLNLMRRNALRSELVLNLN